MGSVAILGAGPAGMMAAHAAARNGLEPVVYAAERKPSIVPLDAYLQRPLPGVPGVTAGWPDARINYVRWGHAQGYATKVYGRADAPISWDRIRWGYGDVWWLRDTYLRLYERYEGNIVELSVGYPNAEAIRLAHGLVLSTLPGPALCSGGHHFDAVDTWLLRVPSTRDSFEMVYNGRDNDDWFRMSALRGWLTWEHRERPKTIAIEGDELYLGQKLIGNGCNCHSRIYRVGRWAQWRRGVLLHHAFEQSTAILASEGLGKGA